MEGTLQLSILSTFHHLSCVFFFSAEVYRLHLDLKDDKNSYVVFIGARPLSGPWTQQVAIQVYTCSNKERL